MSEPQPAPPTALPSKSPNARRRFALLGIPIAATVVAVGVWVFLPEDPAAPVAAPTTTAPAVSAKPAPTSPTFNAAAFADRWTKRLDAVKSAVSEPCGQERVQTLVCGQFLLDIVKVVDELDQELQVTAAPFPKTAGAIRTLKDSARRYVDLGCVRGLATAEDCWGAALGVVMRTSVTSALMSEALTA